MDAQSDWIETLLAAGDARGEGVGVKDPSGRFVARNLAFEAAYGQMASARMGPEAIQGALSEVAVLTDRYVQDSGRPVRLVVPGPLGWHRATKFAFRSYLVVAITPVDEGSVRDRILENFPAVSRPCASFLVEALARSAASPRGEVTLAELSTPRSSAGRYLRQLETLRLIRRERSGRGLRLFARPAVFLLEPRELSPTGVG